MKRIIFLSIVTMFAISNYAQIETYESASPQSTISFEEVQKQYPNLSEEEQIELYFELRTVGKAKTWQERKNQRLESIQQNTTYPLVNLSSDANFDWKKIQHINRYLIGDTLYSVRNEKERKPIFALISTNNSIRVSKLPVGEYFQVIDMLVCQQDKDSLFNSFNNKTFVEEKITIYDGQKPCQLRKTVQVGMEDVLGFSKPIKAPIWEAMYKNISPIYVLKKNDTIYYAEWFEEKYNRYDSRSRRDFSPQTSPLNNSSFYLADISDFVSVKSYNMLKDMYIGKELVPIKTGDLHNKKEFIEQVEESSIWTIKKLLVKGADFYVECISNNGQSNNQNIKEIRNTNYISDKYFGNYVPDYVDTTTVDTFSVIMLENYQNFMLKTEADALITKWKYEEEQKRYKEEQERLADEKKQEEYRKSMIRKYGEKYGNCIAKGEICIGMTKEMCKETLGIPHHTNKTTDILGEVEVWTYISNWAESVFFKIEEEEYMFVTFMDGKVTSITE